MIIRPVGKDNICWMVDVLNQFHKEDFDYRKYDEKGFLEFWGTDDLEKHVFGFCDESVNEYVGWFGLYLAKNNTCQLFGPYLKNQNDLDLLEKAFVMAFDCAKARYDGVYINTNDHKLLPLVLKNGFRKIAKYNYYVRGIEREEDLLDLNYRFALKEDAGLIEDLYSKIFAADDSLIYDFSKKQILADLNKGHRIIILYAETGLPIGFSEFSVVVRPLSEGQLSREEILNFCLATTDQLIDSRVNRYAILEFIGIVPDCRGFGYGNRLFRITMRNMLLCGASSVILCVVEGSVAEKMYQSKGFFIYKSKELYEFKFS